MARVPADATAFAHRAAADHGERRARSTSGPRRRPAHEAWVNGFAAALRQGEPGAYVNFLGDEGAGASARGLPGPTWDRLAGSRRATTRPTSSGSTRTSRRRPGI